MSRPPKLDLASIVAAATPKGRKPEPSKAGLGKAEPRPSAEIVRLDMPAPRPRANAPLKQRARQMSVYLEPPVYDQLRELAHVERTKMHALMLEALDLLFRQRGALPIDQIGEDGDR